MRLYLFLLLQIVGISFAKPHNFTEKLDIFPIQELEKSLLHFTFEFHHDLNLNSIIVKNTLWPRALLEQLFIFSKIKYLQVQMATGGLHPILKEKFPFELPFEGTKFIMNADSDYEKALIYMSEVFGTTRHNFMKENSFKLKTDKGFKKNNKQNEYNWYDWDNQNEIIYGNDPTDFYCSENLLLLKKYLGCQGQKGLAILLESNQIFRASYNSHITTLLYNEDQKDFSLRIEYNVIISPDQKSKYFMNSLKISQCPIYNSSSLHTQESDVDLKESGRYPFDFVQLNSQKQIKYREEEINPVSFVTGEWFSSQTILYHEFQNPSKTNKMKFQLFIYLPFFLRPKMYTIKLTEISNLIQFEITNTSITTLTVSEDDFNGRRGYFLISISAEISPNNKLQISLEIEKLMKAFEDYPHDPGKGHFILTAPLFYQIGSNPIKHIFTNNVLTKIPEPDFSMPFNILTYTMVTFGYLFITIYRLSVDKEKIHWIEGGQLSKFQKIINYFKRFV